MTNGFAKTGSITLQAEKSKHLVMCSKSNGLFRHEKKLKKRCDKFVWLLGYYNCRIYSSI